jgi:hypothetical protein
MVVVVVVVVSAHACPLAEIWNDKYFLGKPKVQQSTGTNHAPVTQ